MRIHHSIVHDESLARSTAECDRCGESFEYYPSDKPGVYCPDCVEDSEAFLGDPQERDAERVERSCKHCGRSMSVLRSTVERGHGKFCGQECFADWLSENVVGEAHHQWEEGNVKYGGDWWRVRRQALERDDHSCRRCGRTREGIGREPDAHRVERVRDFDDPQDAHRLDNVVSPCRRCHRRVEAGAVPAPGPIGSER